ncbi:OmpA family protein [Desulfoluna sp.]|uniref:OmpA/MotB family protein n=1 Tax=Desulfoluna sp. TaxID=2045199 RepID=UPI002613B544|nr:OmpA family protein [Desulfoluna sp.]
MIRFKKRQSISDNDNDYQSEGYWASYSDLMAALLMIFALTTVAAIVDIGSRVDESTQVLEEWDKVVKTISSYKGFESIEGVTIDADTGALVISNDSLRFGFGSVEVSEAGKSVLQSVVPMYMALVYKNPELLKRIEAIEVSGHTDRMDLRGGNPYLSRERAGQVLKFLMGDPAMGPYLDTWKTKAVAAGYSAIRFPEQCEEDRCAMARRVEITILLNEREMLQNFLQTLRHIIR